MVAVLALLLCGFLWYRSQRDLDVVEAHARACGVVMAQLEPDVAAQQAWDAIASRVPATRALLGNRTSAVWPEGQARAALTSQEMCGILRDIDLIPAGRLGLGAGKSVNLVDLLAVQMWLTEDAEVPRSVHRVRHVMESAGPPGTCRSWLRPALLSASLHVLPHRLAGGHLPADPGLVQDLLALADLVEGDLRQGEGLVFASELSNARKGPPHLTIGMLGKESIGVWDSILCCLSERAGRATFLEQRLDDVMAARTSDLGALALRGAHPIVVPAFLGIPACSPGRFLQQMWDPRRFIEARIRTPLHLRLLAAELGGTPWPADPFADPPAPLHRVERDGVLIGAWSVGRNGTAEGGDLQSDLCLPLRGIVGSPRMGDPMVIDGADLQR